MRIITSLLSGLIFGVGLVVSGMSNPAKVLNFLDLAGSWDPSLLFVMAGAVVVTFVGYRLVQSRPQPAFADRFHLPTAKDVDGPLVVGAVCFGLGWGLSGFCPGPAMTSIALQATGTKIIVPMMLAGMWIGRSSRPWFEAKLPRPQLQ